MRSSVAVWRRPLIVITALILSLLAVLIRPVPAHAETVYTVINFPAAVVQNHCNQNWVALQGELHLLVNTTPTPNGGSTVRSIAVSEGLQGTDLVTNVPYRAIDAELSFLNYVPPPGTGTL